MIKDKLTKKQRIRLESLALACSSHGVGSSAETIVYRAKVFENYVREDK